MRRLACRCEFGGLDGDENGDRYRWSVISHLFRRKKILMHAELFATASGSASIEPASARIVNLPPQHGLPP
jgi:hypothetical protein